MGRQIAAVFVILGGMVSAMSGCSADNGKDDGVQHPEWVEPVSISCKFTRVTKSSYGYASDTEYNEVCMDGSGCSDFMFGSSDDSLGDFSSFSSNEDLQDYFGSCDDPNAVPMSCEETPTDAHEQSCAKYFCCGYYSQVLADPNALWYFSCLEPCEDDACVSACDSAAASMPYGSRTAIDNFATCYTDYCINGI